MSEPSTYLKEETERVNWRKHRLVLSVATKRKTMGKYAHCDSCNNVIVLEGNLLYNTINYGFKVIGN
jgi:hypothetical protein